jgi:RNA-binding protein
MIGQLKMALTPDKKKELKSKARALEPLVRLGKNGLTPTVVLQVKRLLDKRSLVKVKFLRAFLDSHDRKSASEELAQKTGSELVDQVGFVVVLYRRPGAKMSRTHK